jgi:hypothetical protein
LRTEEFFKAAYLMTDCTLGNPQFVGRARKRAMAGDCVERDKRAEGWHATDHWGPMIQIHAVLRNDHSRHPELYGIKAA